MRLKPRLRLKMNRITQDDMRKEVYKRLRKYVI